MVDDFFTCVISGTCVSAVFSLITFIVYIRKTELNNTQGWIVCSYAVSYILHMFLSAIMFAVMKHYPENDNPYLLCGTVLGTWYFFLASMLWINVMSLEIWTNLRKSRSVVQDQDKTDYQELRFTRYVIVVCSSLVFYSLAISCSTIWISELSEFSHRLLIISLWTVIGVTVCCTTLFIWTPVIVTERDEEEKRFDDTVDIRHEVNKEWFDIYLGLFLAMEVPLILAVSIFWNILSAFVFGTILAVIQGITIFAIIVNIRMPDG